MKMRWISNNANPFQFSYTYGTTVNNNMKDEQYGFRIEPEPPINAL
jgi:hypothetical protein